MSDKTHIIHDVFFWPTQKDLYLNLDILKKIAYDVKFSILNNKNWLFKMKWIKY